MNSKRFFLETYGCAANKSDSERLMRILANHEWFSVNTPDEADLVIINSCGVKQPTERKILRRLSELENTKQKPWATVVTGCLPNMSLKAIKKNHPNYGAILDTKSTHLFSSILSRLENGERQIELFAPSRNTALGKLDIFPLSFNPLIGILTINEGCDGNCSFCGTKLARGRALSHSPQALLSQTEMLLKNGCRELWITSQDTGSYRYTVDGMVWELPELLDAICKLPYRFRLRLGMINPDHLLHLQFKRTENRLFDVFANHSQIFSFLHIPVQSGNDRILELMKRRYSVREFKNIISAIKKRFPRMTLSTDVIIGFPSESEEDFQDTVKLIKWFSPPVLNISRFGARPGTVAASMDGQIHERISKERSRLMTKIWQPIAFKENQKWLGWEGQVLIDEKGKQLGKQSINEDKQQNTVIGRNWAYKPIVITKNIPLGSYVTVSIFEARDHYLIGRVSENSNSSRD
ncbi:MAG: tRNA (N(6)-L-threonylcarbamoyladenosine(37)-C(2))-methylthiotransferase [Candidatus Hodarchaeales archaeon]